MLKVPIYELLFKEARDLQPRQIFLKGYLASNHPIGRWYASGLSSAHIPDSDIERARIEAAGGCVRNNRVDGILALSV